MGGTKINERPASTLYGGWTAVKQIGRSSEGFCCCEHIAFNARLNVRIAFGVAFAFDTYDDSLGAFF